MKVRPNSYNPFPCLVDALRLLPRIRPVCERQRLGEAKYEASLSRDRKTSINGISVTLAELDQLFVHGECARPRISQAGAAFLVRLYKKGAFDLIEDRSVDGGLELLTLYSEGLATIIDARYWRTVRRPPAAAGKVTQRKPAPVENPERTRHPAASISVHRLI